MSFTITMPQLGETVTEGTILSWVKQIGEYVAEDDILVEISTDKVDTELPSPKAGVLTEILVAAGTTVDVGTPIAVLDVSGGGGATADASGTIEASHRESATESDEPGERPAEADASVREAADAKTERRGVLSPVVRKLADEHGIDLAMVPGTGGGGRITRKDVEAFIATHVPGEATQRRAETPAEPVATSEPGRVASAPSGAHPAPAAGEVRKISHLRERIAENLIDARRTAARRGSGSHRRTTGCRARCSARRYAPDRYADRWRTAPS